jgi:hypothetical protein
MGKRLAMIFGAMFVLVGLLGYVDNPLIGPDGMFVTNGNHNLAHLLIGVVLLIAATRGDRASTMSMHVFGAIYALLAVLGFAAVGSEGHAMLFDLVHVNGADNWLHVFLAVALFGSALAASRTHRTLAPGGHAAR